MFCKLFETNTKKSCFKTREYRERNRSAKTSYDTNSKVFETLASKRRTILNGSTELCMSAFHGNEKKFMLSFCISLVYS